MDDIQLVMKVDTAPVDRAVRVMDNLEAELRDVERAMDKNLITEKQYNAETQRLTQSMARLKTVAKGSSKDFRAFEKTVYGSGKAMRQKEIAMQQAGYQLQDFIVQVQAGTNPLIAFSQQGSQLAGFFAGPWGAAIGLGIAALGGLGTAILGAGGKMQSLQDQVEAFAELTDSWHGSAKTASTQTEVLARAFGNLAENIKLSLDKLADFEAKLQEQAFQDVAASMRDKYVTGGGGERRTALADLFGLGLNFKGGTEIKGTGTFGFGREEVAGNQLGELVSGFGAVSETTDPEERLGILTNMVNAAIDLANANGEISKQEQELINTLTKQKETYESIVSTKKLGLNVNPQDQEDEYQDRLHRTKVIMVQIEKERQEAAKREIQDAATIRAAMQSAAIKRRDSEKAAEEQLANDRLQISSALQASYLKSTAEREQAEYEAYQRGIDHRYKGEAALFDQAVEISDKLLEKIEEDAEKAARAYENAFNASSFLFANRFADETALMNMPVTIDPDNKPDSKKKGKTPAQKLDEYMKGLERTVKLEQKQVGVSEEVARTLELREEYEKRGLKVNNSRIDALVKEEEALRKATELQEKHTARVDMIGDAFGDMLMGIVDGTMKADEAFKNFMYNIIKQLYQELAIDPAVSFLKSFLLADGGVMSRGKLTPFAYGGVVNGPTVFPMANGMGLMGESGPEAIMPLKRGPNGKLGVEGGGGVTVVQNINVSTGVQQTVRTEIKSLMPQIAEASKAAVADAKRRGGSYGRNFA
jgi:hypothetical protein